MRALYVRTSTGKQDGQAQLFQLREAARARGWLEPLELVDLDQSGKRSIRPALEDLRRRARAGELREVLIVGLDRLGRDAVDVIRLVDELAGAGMVLHSLREGTIDPKSPIGRAIVQILSSIAELEHALISERVNSGLARARKEGTRSGKPIGRPTRDVDVTRAREMLAAGRSWRFVAAALKCPLPTLRRKLAAVSKPPLTGEATATASKGSSGESAGVSRK